MNIYKLRFLIITLLLFSVNTILAIDCPRPGTPLEELNRATAVFSGKVVAQERQKITDKSSEDFESERLLIRIKVDKWWKGNGDNEVVLRTSTVYFPNGGRREDEEDFFFSTKEKYIVYASYYNGAFATNDCTRTKKLSQADDDLKELGKGFPPKKIQKCPTILMFPTDVPDIRKDTLVFSVRLENVDPKLKLTYQWTVYNGEKLYEIKSGQGTPSITITNDKIDFHDGVRVLVEVGGLENGCENKGVIGIIS